MELIDIEVKSNVTLKDGKLEPPTDNLSDQYLDPRLRDTLSPMQRELFENMMYWAEKVIDSKGHVYTDICYKGCHDCGKENNHCQRPYNKKMRLINNG